MPDNVIAPGAGVSFATDEVGGVHFPYAKLAFGPDNSAVLVADANGARVPVLIYVQPGQAIGLDTATLAALETIELGATTLAALETIELGATTLAALETITALIGSLPLPAGASTEATLAALSAKLGSLGQKAMAGSAPVTIASDQSAVPTIADNYGKSIASNTLTRQANTTAYAAGQIVGGSATAGFANNGFTIAGFARVPAGTVRIERMRFYKSQNTAAGSFEVRLYRGSPTMTVGDAGSAASGLAVGAASGNARLVARFTFDMTTAALGSDGAELGALSTTGAPVTVTLPSGSTDLFAVVVALGAYTPLSGEQFSIVLEGYSF